LVQAAADAGWLPSMLALGTILEDAGQKREAARLYEIAANKGHAEGVLGTQYLIERNPLKAQRAS
jgi:TPR repeat protein